MSGLTHLLALLLALAMLGAALVTILGRSLPIAILASGLVSLCASVLFLILAAPDVAMTEAAIGSALTTFLFFFILGRMRRELPGVLHAISALSTEYDLRVANVFHAGDGNMHPLILFDANQPGELDRAEALGGKILELCVKVGGSITGEHGVGREKINQMCAQFNSDELTLFHAVKAAFDPSGLLNPGKNIPTLHRCAEFGAMHVHLGQMPFPELERF